MNKLDNSNIPQYQVGDMVRVLVDQPLNADLSAGDIVEILEILRMGDRPYPAYTVTRGWCLNYKVIEPLGNLVLENK